MVDVMNAGFERTRGPRISVVMANFRGARWLEKAMRSVLAQSHHDLELILADDASDDDSVAIGRAIAATDTRVHVLALSQNGGPAVARNHALDVATGDWIAIVDSDDIIHPDRLRRLLATAEATGADIVADDLVHFGASGGDTLLARMELAAPMHVNAALFMRSNGADPALPGLGYLKPMIARRTLGARRYDPSLLIGEDFDLVMRMLIDGASLVVVPDPLYAYRRHASSISHRMTVARAKAMLDAHRSLPRMPDVATTQAAAAVQRHLERGLRYEMLVQDIKARRAGAVLPRLVDPVMLARLVGSVRDRYRRRRDAPAPSNAAPCPPLPPTGQPWAHPPAPAAAWVAAGGRPDPLPDWAQWLRDAVGP